MLTVSKIIEAALQEDVLTGDITTMTTVPAEARGNGIIYMKESGILSGIKIAREVFYQIDPTIALVEKVVDGQQVEKGQTVLEISGSLRSILTGERVALNFLQRMSGIATKTNHLVKLIEGYHATVADTRKTTPLLRLLEKQAVRDGGGKNHRFGLYDAVMIKDNHIKAAGGILQAVKAARNGIPHTMKIEVEVENLIQLNEAISAQADVIMLDNMEPVLMEQAVKIVAGRALTEASGGVNEQKIVEIAKTGVDYISLGGLTHSIKSLDISLDLFEKKVVTL